MVTWDCWWEGGSTPPWGRAGEERAAGCLLWTLSFLGGRGKARAGGSAPETPRGRCLACGQPLRSDLLAGVLASHRALEPEGWRRSGAGPVPEPCIWGTALAGLFFTFWGQECKIPVSLSSRKPGITHGRCLTNTLSE